MRQFKIEKTDKDYFVITISGVNLGKFERSDIRHIIEQMDDAIGTEIDWKDTLIEYTKNEPLGDIFKN